VLDMSKLISQRQLVAGSWGNVSARIDKNTYAITPSGRPYATMVLEDIAVIDSHGQKLTGNYLPSSETKLHVAIYQKFPEAGGIIHTHSIYACVLAACHKDLPPIMEDLVQVLGGPVTCAKYALPGTEELAQNVVAAMEHTSAAFMANHGLVCWGRDVKEAYLISELVEKTARIYCKTLALGPAQEISPEDAQIMHKFYLEHYSKRQRGEEKK
jgi:L-fuculose-phosphate aldolase